MSVPMVQNKPRRRSGLVMGVLLALLLGIAAGFFVLALPIRMLETVTTFTRLSKLLVQAEPPISPNDRSVLAVLIGLLVAGVGWVLVDWLLFARAGMSRLIRTQEDDFEEEDDYSFRSTDPLDLVAPVTAAAGDWSVPAPGDARRPLSALTDIGDPPKAPMPTPFGSALQPPVFDLPLPPVDIILPGVGTTAPALQPNALPPLFPTAQPAPDPFARPVMGDMPAFPPARPASAAPSAVPGWLPAPGLRSERVEDEGEASPSLDPVLPEPAIDSLPGRPPELPVGLMDSPPAWPPVAEPSPVFETPPAPPMPSIDAFAPPPVIAPSEAAPPVAPAPPPRTTQPAAAVPNLIAGIEKARLEELLDRLELGLQKRRAAATAIADARSAESAAPPAPAPLARPAAPAGFSAPPMPFPELAPAPAPVAAPPEIPAAPPPAPGNAELLDQPLHVTLEMLRNRVKR